MRRLGIVLCLLVTIVAAEENKEELKLEEKSVVTDHVVTVRGKKVPYQATAGTILLKDEKESSQASIFYVAYTRSDVKDRSKRPLIFAFNGGPGASSVFLHLGLLGPKRIAMDNEGLEPLYPYHLVENQESLLDKADFVFIDPVATGLSRPCKPEALCQFHNVEGDIKSVAEMIRLYVNRHNRWLSPLYLAGESYGTTRAAGVAAELHQTHRVTLNGIILISVALDFKTIRLTDSNELPYTLHLPTYAAVAWYHNRISHQKYPNLSDLLEEVKDFTYNVYTPFLMKGLDVSEAEKTDVALKLAMYTGIDVKQIQDNYFRLSYPHFRKEVLKQSGMVVGRFDGRVKGFRPVGIGKGERHFDPSMENMLSAYAMTFNQYLRSDLQWDDDHEYRVLSPLNWDWKGKDWNLYLADDLQEVIYRCPHLKVFAGNGIYDLATSMEGTRYTFNHILVPPELSSYLTIREYEGGHMMYHNPSELKKMREDLASFID